ncbi:S9 family peptidase [Nocardioides bruguierae]|uniref:S9 family peptidase n=1 Tax=Nocardioides bruguierae TaxID=2945102 RepID=UPI002021AD8B|nr:S9 family peptidase [Nocardioides bruguierae]MCL8024301.1 S9 family peptidase [Nocardioides bruguierae]
MATDSSPLPDQQPEQVPAQIPAVQPSEPPLAATRTTTREIHGRVRTDEYEWLRAKDSDEVTGYLAAENAWTQASTAHLADLRESLFEEIRTRTRETDLSVPTRNRGHWYYSRSFEGREYGATCRVPVTDPDDWTPPTPAEDAAHGQPALPGEEVLLDLDALAEGHEFFSLGGAAISPDGTYLAWAVDTVGDERYTIRVKVLATGEILEDVIEGALGGGTWDRSSTHLYYTTVDESWRADKVWRHTLGTSQDTDDLVHHETDERFFVGVGRSRSDRFLVLAAGSKTTSEYRFLDAEDEDAGWQLFCARTEGVDYNLEHAVIGGEDCFLVLHNATGPDYELARTPAAPTPREGWTALVPHDASTRLEDVDAFAGHLVVHQRSDGLTQLRVLDLDEHGISDDYLVHFDAEVYTVGASGNPVFDQPVLRLGYTSMAHPASIYDYDVRSRTLTLRRRTPVLGGYDPDDYEEHRLWGTSPDGTRVPISLVARTGANADGPVPTLLYGYGSYEASIDPYFSIARLSLLDRGAAFAIAHVRGGGEMGRHWYDDGKMAHKQNTFTDFVACARHLVEAGWSSPETLVAEGASAGGLLMGAVATQAPEMFAGIVAGVPFVDNLTTMLDATLPLTVTEYDEWGNPEADAEVYDYIASYAPYDNVTSGPYPPILAETSVNDTRVLYVEPAKWVARLRASVPDRRPEVLLRTEMSGGHGGVSGRYKAWKDRAFALAWMLDRMGLAGIDPR